MPRQDLADLCEVQGAGAAVEQRDPREQEESADPVHDREVDRPLQHGTMLDPIAGQAEGGGAHQLEEDEHVEEVAGESEADHRREKHEHQHEEVRRHLFLEVVDRLDERGSHQRADQRRDSGAERLDAERDADRDPVPRMPAAEPVGDRPVRRVEDENDAEDGHGCRDRSRDEVVDP